MYGADDEERNYTTCADWQQTARSYDNNNCNPCNFPHNQMAPQAATYICASLLLPRIIIKKPLGSAAQVFETHLMKYCYLPLHTVRLIDVTTRWRFRKPLLNTYLGFAAIWLSWARLNFLPIPSANMRTPVFRRARDDPTTESCEIPSVITSSTWRKVNTKLKPK